MRNIFFGLLFFASSTSFAEVSLWNAAAEHTLKAVYDSSKKDYGSSTVDSGVHALGSYLPKNAVITRSWIYVVDQLVDNGTGTLAIFCEDANNIKTATDMTGSAAGAKVEGQSTGAASAFVAGIAADCEVKAKVAGANITAGKLDVFVTYVIAD